MVEKIHEDGRYMIHANLRLLAPSDHMVLTSTASGLKEWTERLEHRGFRDEMYGALFKGSSGALRGRTGRHKPVSGVVTQVVA